MKLVDRKRSLTLSNTEFDIVENRVWHCRERSLTLSGTEFDIVGNGTWHCQEQSQTLSATDRSQSWNHRHLATIMCWAKCPFGGLWIIERALGPSALLVAQGSSKGHLAQTAVWFVYESWTLHPASYTLKLKLIERLWHLTVLVRLCGNTNLWKRRKCPLRQDRERRLKYTLTHVLLDADPQHFLNSVFQPAR